MFFVRLSKHESLFSVFSSKKHVFTVLSGMQFVVFKKSKNRFTPTDRIKNTAFLLFLCIFGFLKIKVPEQVSLSTGRFFIFSKNMIFMFCLLVSTKNTFLMLFLQKISV